MAPQDTSKEKIETTANGINTIVFDAPKKLIKKVAYEIKKPPKHKTENPGQKSSSQDNLQTSKAPKILDAPEPQVSTIEGRIVTG